MPYPLSPDAEEKLAAGRLATVLLVDLYCADDDGPAPIRLSSWHLELSYPANDALNDDDSVNYLPFFGRMTVNRDIRFSQTLSSEPCKITLDGSRAGDDEDPVGLFTDRDWHQRKVRVRQILLDPETWSGSTTPIWEWNGRMDKRQYVRQAGEAQQLTLTNESGLFRIRGRNMHTRTHADQQRRKAGDLFFQPTPLMVGLPIVWGKNVVDLPGGGHFSSGGGGGGANGANNNEKN